MTLPSVKILYTERSDPHEKETQEGRSRHQAEGQAHHAAVGEGRSLRPGDKQGVGRMGEHLRPAALLEGGQATHMVQVVVGDDKARQVLRRSAQAAWIRPAAWRESSTHSSQSAGSPSSRGHWPLVKVSVGLSLTRSAWTVMVRRTL